MDYEKAEIAASKIADDRKYWLIKADGTVDEIVVASGSGKRRRLFEQPHGRCSSLKLKQLQKLVGGYIERIWSCDGRVMVVAEEGRLSGMPVNQLATALYKFGSESNVVVGDVVLFPKNKTTLM